MSDELVTDEMVEAAAIALHNDHQKHHSPWKTAWDASVPEWRAQCTRHARAALAAVAPLIAAAEREACAVVAEGARWDKGQDWRIWAWNNGEPVPEWVEVEAGKMADLIAAAMRARKP